MPPRHTWLQSPLPLQLAQLEMYKFLIPLYYSPCVFSYTVTKAKKIEAFLWKIAVLGTKKSPVGARKFLPCPFWCCTFLHAGNVRGGLNIFIFCALRVWDRINTPTDRSLTLPCSQSFFFSQGKSPENCRNVFRHGGGMETKCSPPLPLVLAPSGQGGGILRKFLLQCTVDASPF